MLTKPSDDLKVPYLLKAQACAAISLTILYTVFAILSIIFLANQYFIITSITLTITHGICSVALIRVVNKKVYASLMLRLSLTLTIICSIFLHIMIFSQIKNIQIFQVGQFAKEGVLDFTFTTTSIIIQLFPLLTLIYSFIGEVNGFLHYITINDGEF